MAGAILAVPPQKRVIIQLGVVLTVLLGTWFLWHRRQTAFQVDLNNNGKAEDACTLEINRARLPESAWYIQFSPSKNHNLLVAGAKTVTAQDLLNDKHPFDETKGRVIHQHWKSHDLSEYPFHHLWRSQDHWIAQHPGWLYVLWDEKDNRDLVEKKYPELLRQYDELKDSAMRARLARFLYLHAFGGIYADLDVLPRQNLLQHLPAFGSTPSGKSSAGVAYVAGVLLSDSSDAIPNSWMASSHPGHPFWKSLSEGSFNNENFGPHETEVKGVGDFAKAVKNWRQKTTNAADLVLLKSPTIFPYSWDETSKAIQCICSGKHQATFDARRCLSLYRDPWTISFWASI